MKLVVFGGGDLAQRVLALLSTISSVREVVVVVTHGQSAAAPLARLYGGCIAAKIGGAEVDWSSPTDVTALLRRERPDIIFHASAFVSPWFAQDRDTPAFQALKAARFGIMAPAQLSKIRTVMQAVHYLGLQCPVVNASYPDLTHAVLAAEGLAPTIGVGNAGMIFHCLATALRDRATGSVPRLLAHHGQVTPFAQRQSYTPGKKPWLFLDEEPVDIDSFICGPLPTGRLLNALTAVHAIEIVKALLEQESDLRTSAPGPAGLQGGWPVRVSHQGVSLDLPKSVSVEQASSYQRHAAVADGISMIDADGTVYYEDSVRMVLAPIAPELAEPLRREDLTKRLARLMEIVSG